MRRSAGDFQAILCDNIDRFSRSDMDEVQEVALALNSCWVRWIVSAAGTFDLGRSGHDIGEALSSSSRFGHRMNTPASCPAALPLPCGTVPRTASARRRTLYGMVDDGKGGLKLNRQMVGVGNKKMRECEIVLDGVPLVCQPTLQVDKLDRGRIEPAEGSNEAGRQSGAFRRFPMLRRRAYAGDLVFNQRSQASFSSSTMMAKSRKSASGRVPGTRPRTRDSSCIRASTRALCRRNCSTRRAAVGRLRPGRYASAAC